MEKVLQVVDVSKSYKSRLALKKVSFEMPQSEVWALTGPNGAGKTTLLKVILGLMKPDSGSVIWDTVSPIKDREEFQKLVRYVPQKANLYPNLTVGETMEFFALLREADNLEDTMENFDLISIKDQFLRTLSGGQRQKVVVAQAFLGKGKYFIMDEPTINLDNETAENVKIMIRQIANDGGYVLLTTHIEDDLAKQLIDHRILMEDGSVKEIK